MHKNIILCFYLSTVTLVWSRRINREREREWEFAHMEEPPGIGTASENWLQQKFSRLYSLKTPTRPTHNACFSLAMVYTHVILAFHWPRLTSTLGLFFIGCGLHPRNACSLLVTAYTHASFVSGNRFVDFYLQPDVSVNNIHRVDRR